MQTEALVDSGATTNFIDKEFVINNHLVTSKLASPYNVLNADGTPNVAGRITDYVHAYVEIGSHKSTHYVFVTHLGNKNMMIGYLYLHQHDPLSTGEQGNGSSPGAQIHALIKPVKQEITKLEPNSSNSNQIYHGNLRWTN